MTAPSAVGVLREVVEAARAVESVADHATFVSDECCCGSRIDAHGMGDGHAPVDSGSYYGGQALDALRTALTQADAALASLEAAEGVVVDDAMVERACVAATATYGTPWSDSLWDHRKGDRERFRNTMRAALTAALTPPAAASDGEGE